MNLMSVRDLSVVFDAPGGQVDAVRSVSLDVADGEFVGVVGESGSGKSVAARALMGMVDRPGRIASGSVTYQGRDILAMPEGAVRDLRGREIAMVFQDPKSSLNPVFTIGQQLDMVMRAHGRRASGDELARMLQDVEIPAASKRLRQYPHELSGGMRQRVMIAMALANQPRLLIADEPTTALDVTIQAQILQLLQRINRERGTAILLISHSLDVIAEVADKVLVMYAGKIVEHGRTGEVFGNPRHPYTNALLHATPRADGEPMIPLTGMPPTLSPPPVGCAFAARCRHRFDACGDQPELVTVGETHAAACWLADQLPFHATSLAGAEHAN
ncbi:ABC transporter ATP-binding protein [Agromyces bauzanensis]